jgi:DNA-binding response OmpR family regulator
MSQILLASTPEGAYSLKRILQGHELFVVETMKAARQAFRSQTFDLSIVSLHFDQSLMFEFMREASASSNNGTKPIICYCARETEMSRIMHESLEYTTRYFGAWMYLVEHAYNVYKEPDEELRRVIERCLTAEARKEIQQQRTDVQKERTELHELKVMLETKLLSPELNEYVHQLRRELELLLLKVVELQLSADSHRSKVESSRDLKDRVSDHVTMKENAMTQAEENQSLEEARQLAREDELAAREIARDAQKWRP